METTDTHATNRTFALGFNLRSAFLIFMLLIIICGGVAIGLYTGAPVELWQFKDDIEIHSYWAGSFASMPGVRQYALAMLEADKAELARAELVAAICWLPFAMTCFIALVPLIRRRYTQREFLVIKYTFYASLFYLLRMLSYPT